MNSRYEDLVRREQVRTLLYAIGEQIEANIEAESGDPAAVARAVVAAGVLDCVKSTSTNAELRVATNFLIAYDNGLLNGDA
ncbi:hypothetical protein D5S17_14500 [Pseudonocardiaceae bacterium YIM PH 21723]|nr:hypothetical protein D5S17_14500 [Pseudonocardiaceae bacterium YIM PH 21723]